MLDIIFIVVIIGFIILLNFSRGLKQMTYKTYKVKVYNNGHKAWYLNGKLHREDGPAIEFNDGSKEWYLNGIEYTEAEWKAKLNPVKELSVKEISDLLGYEVKVVK